MGIEPLADKWRAFGWEVRESTATASPRSSTPSTPCRSSSNKPNCLITHTVKGKGASFAEDTYLWHQNTVNEEIYDKAIAELETV